MADFNIRSDAVDVEQIMRQIRTRIQEKRGVDYTEEQIRELAAVRLEKFLDSKNLRSDLIEQFRKSRPPIPSPPPPIEPPYAFDDQTLFATHRGPLRFMRNLLRPVLKLFFNPNTLNQILHTQAKFNGEVLEREQREHTRRIEFEKQRAEWNALYYEILHNLVFETTRSGIEVKNLKMRVESLSSRLDFSERRVRALEGVVQYRPEAVRNRDIRPVEADGADAPSGPTPAESAAGPRAAGDSAGRRRRRRRRGRRGPGLGPGDASRPQLDGAAEEPSMDEGYQAEGPGDDLDGPGEPEADFDGPDSADDGNGDDRSGGTDRTDGADEQ